jgi:hypothetical protein
MKTRITPSRVRSVGLREAAWLAGAGTPYGDFEPMPCFCHGPYCDCEACQFREQGRPELEAVPDFEFPQTREYNRNGGPKSPGSGRSVRRPAVGHIVPNWHAIAALGLVTVAYVAVGWLVWWTCE